MQLGILERLVLLSVLPKEGDFMTLKVLRNLREDLSFSEAEHKELQFSRNAETGNIEWQKSGDKVKDITIGEKATDIVKAVLKKLDEEKKLSDDLYTVYEKFM